MNYKRYKKYIVVDEEGRPMAFNKDQFCYAQTENSRSPFALQSYTLIQARDLIKKTIEFRAKNNFLGGAEKYILMPIGEKGKPY